MTPRELLIRLRDPDCTCCPLYEECQNATDCLLFAEAANCIETLMQKGEQNGQS